MKKISDNQAVQVAADVRPLTEINERECLAELAKEVPDGGLIVEIGALYGGTTGVLALANPSARVVTMDDWSWHPADDQPTSERLLYQNMQKIGVENVTVLTGDSREIGKAWNEPIDFLFIDGGHSFDWVYKDLSQFGPHAQVIALHDFDNPFWKSVRQAVELFLQSQGGWEIAKVVGQVCVLRRV